MIRTVDRFRAENRYDDALRYLDRYLPRHSTSYPGWRYRVLLRLEQRRRADAAREYARLAAALRQHSPEILKELVVGFGARWLINDYGALARCGPEGVADLSFFRDELTSKSVYEGSNVKLEVPADRVAAMMRALPGRLGPAAVELIEVGYADGDPVVRKEAALAAVRLWQRGEPTAKELLQRVMATSDPAVLRPVLLALHQGSENSSPPPLPSEHSDPAIDALLASLLQERALAGEEASRGILTRKAALSQGFSRLIALGFLGRQEPPPFQSGVTVSGKGEILPASAKAFPHPGTASRALEDLARGGLSGAERIAAMALLHQDWPAVYPALWVQTVWSKAGVEDRRLATRLLLTRPPIDAGTLLAAALADGDALVRASLATALGSWPQRPDRNLALTTLLADASPAVRAQAFESAASLLDPSLVEAVASAFTRAEGTSEQVQFLETLAAAGTGPYQAVAAAALVSSDPGVREASVGALLSACDPATEPALVKALSDPDPHVAVRAAAGVYLLVGGPRSPSGG